MAAVNVSDAVDSVPLAGHQEPDRSWVRHGTRWLRRMCGLRLGVFHQYGPRPLALPCDYGNVQAKAGVPTMAVVTPSYQQAHFLVRTIESVLGQGYPRLQYVIQDGASKDGTRDILDRYRRRVHHAESTRDRGQSHAINLAFAHTTGEIMAYLNSDDLLLPGALNYVGNFFADHPDVDVVYGQRVIIDEQDRDVGRWVMPPHDAAALLWNDYVPQETLFWRRRIWDKAGGMIREELHSAMDWDLLLRFQEAGAVFRRLPRFLGAFRVHPQQKTQARQDDLGRPEARQVRERFHRRSVSRAEVILRVLPFLTKHIICHRLYRLGILHY